jgi:hypothetical protein
MDHLHGTRLQVVRWSPFACSGQPNRQSSNDVLLSEHQVERQSFSLRDLSYVVRPRFDSVKSANVATY